jgi:thiamine pyrophosphate-dependent acetolactate synthase large subunit-like protein
MKFEDCFALLTARRTDELVITSAGNSSELWWTLTGDSESTFYLEASMSLASMFAAGIARGLPSAKVWAFSGDGAFAMNPGMLMVERQMALPNMTHFLVSNRVYGATSNAPVPNRVDNDYAAMARAAGLENVYEFDDLSKLEGGLDDVLRRNGPAFVVLEAEPLASPAESPPIDGPELKFRFGRYIERTYGVAVFTDQV